ncbi:hypothetical protein SMB34_10320 [Thalassospira permensis NBRC 106175]|uniref:Uncharacterized protein n=1 Tax=Thalassospira permensis NBRC 106175 TaxID=1353532 RepID=A0ABR4TIA2_9PROT|nr:hypothetical protein SMB34_10320 [Thalassospira permensis NBRC 106175]
MSFPLIFKLHWFHRSNAYSLRADKKLEQKFANSPLKLSEAKLFT